MACLPLLSAQRQVPAYHVVRRSGEFPRPSGPRPRPSSVAVVCLERGRPSEWESTKPSFRTPLQHRRVRGLTPGSLSGGENGWTIRRSPLREESTGRLPGRLRKLGEDCLVLLVVWRERLDYPPVAYQEKCGWTLRSYAYRLHIAIGEYGSYTWVAPGMERTLDYPPVAFERGEYRKVTQTPEEARRGLLSTSGGMERTAGLSPVAYQETCGWTLRSYAYRLNIAIGGYESYTWVAPGMEGTVGLSAGRLPESRVQSVLLHEVTLPALPMTQKTRATKNLDPTLADIENAIGEERKKKIEEAIELLLLRVAMLFVCTKCFERQNKTEQSTAKQGRAETDKIEQKGAEKDKSEQERAKLGRAGQTSEEKGRIGQNWAELGRTGQCRAMQGNAGQCRAMQGNAGQCRAMQGNAGQCRAMQGNAGQCRAMQGNAGQCRAMQGNAGQCRAMQGNAGQCRAMQGNAGQCRAMQGNAGQCRAMQGKTGQNRAE
ncbi:Ribosome-binding protein 1 [Habropoda laboriosa]|uniref:Ribosome-binding protein 1 n=1 Tax=Habropoda laboriosa TaxID=597456 RepID=A0A0L7RI30_9HYME|nr:Ribosome-binding protein 1 [Habropoda laboriosa]